MASNPFVRAIVGQGTAAVKDLAGSADPTASSGVAAPLGSTYAKTDDGTLWLKTGSAATAWTKIQTLIPVTFTSGAADPSAGGGVAAAEGTVYRRTGTNELYFKAGSGDTAWERLAYASELS